MSKQPAAPKVEEQPEGVTLVEQEAATVREPLDDGLVRFKVPAHLGKELHVTVGTKPTVTYQVEGGVVAVPVADSHAFQATFAEATPNSAAARDAVLESSGAEPEPAIAPRPPIAPAPSGPAVAATSGTAGR